MTSERLFNSFIFPQHFYTPPQKKKILATPLGTIGYKAKLGEVSHNLYRKNVWLRFIDLYSLQALVLLGER